MLEDAHAGTLLIETPQGKVAAAVGDIGLKPRTFDFGGLDRRLTLFRLPDENSCRSMVFEHAIALAPGRDNPLYVSVVTEDGHQAWSSPIRAEAGVDGVERGD